jgi:hypothetical protein
MMLAIVCAGLFGTIASIDAPTAAEVKESYEEAKARPVDRPTNRSSWRSGASRTA